MTLRLEGVESPHSTACLPKILDSILHATILLVHEISNFGERTSSIDHIPITMGPFKNCKILRIQQKTTYHNTKLLHDTMQCNAMQLNAMQCNLMQCNATQRNPTWRT
jgi:hypothetical protein